jgi:tRNA(Ile)-lysidine synthase
VRAAEQQPRPFSDDEINTLFEPAARQPHVAVAVSGGSDSIALMRLAHRWSSAGDDRPKLTVLTVDHGLRPESADEARSVAGWARDLGLDHVVLQWRGTKPASGLAAAARGARYRLMSDWCRSNGVGFLLVAHTLDDQAETVMMRLARGAGVEGLGAMSALTSHHGLTIFRPLLAIARNRLRDYLRTIGQDWCEDPTNQDERFERVRLRKALEVLNATGVGAEAISQTAARSRRAWEAIFTITNRYLRQSLSHHAEGFGEVGLTSLMGEPEEIRIRALWLLVRRYGDGGFLELSQAEALSRWLDQETGAARTLGGCRIVRRPTGLLFGREPGRISPEPIPVPRSGILRWDNRFDIAAAEGRADIAIVAAGRAGKVARRPDLPAFVQAGLPAVLLAGELAAIPSLGLTTEAAPPGFKVSATFGPSWP